MAWKQKRRIMHRYDQSARVYDIQYFEEQEAKMKTVMQNVSLHQNGTALDVGCGTGLLFKHLTNKAESIVGLDISRGLLIEAKKKMQGHQDISLIQADADNLPFIEKTFSSVFAVTLVQNTPNVDTALTEIKRVSKPTALIVVTGLKKKFSREDFLKMLDRAGLKVETIEIDPQNREYVCICRMALR